MDHICLSSTFHRLLIDDAQCKQNCTFCLLCEFHQAMVYLIISHITELSPEVA